MTTKLPTASLVMGERVLLTHGPARDAALNLLDVQAKLAPFLRREKTQRRDQMNVARFLIAGAAASALFLVLDMAFGMLGGWLGTRLFGLPAAQPADLSKKTRLGLLFEVVNGFMLAFVYALIQGSLPGQGWVKGIPYGLIVWGLRVVMWAFSTYVMTDMSPITIGINVVTGLVEVLLLGVTIAAIYGTSAL
jgi:hypothetical protein